MQPGAEGNRGLAYTKESSLRATFRSHIIRSAQLRHAALQGKVQTCNISHVQCAAAPQNTIRHCGTCAGWGHR